MSFLTSFCDLPQNEQRRVSSVRLTIIYAGSSLQNQILLGNNNWCGGALSTSDHLIVTANALIANKSTLADHLSGDAWHSLWGASHHVCYFVFCLTTKRTAKTSSLHLSNHRPGLQTRARLLPVRDDL